MILLTSTSNYTMSRTQQAWACVEHGKPLQKIELPIPEPQGTEVLIRVTHAGVCHSDLHAWEGYYNLGGGKKFFLKDRGVTLPRALGHEILGSVEKLGPDAEQLPIGASRIVYPWVGCQTCRRCEDGDDNLCLKQQTRGVFTDGGFAQYITVPHAKYLVEYGNVDPAVACTYGCSGLTVLSCIQKIMPLKPQDPVLLIGAGGLGLAGIAMLKAMGHEKIVCCDITPEKRQAALDAGATGVFDSTAPEAAKVAIETAGEPYFAALDFVNTTRTAELGMSSLAKGGKLVAVGILGGELNISLVSMIFTARSIMGNITGNPQHLRDVTKLATDGKLAPIPVTKVPWDEANEALMRLNRGEVTGRLILIH